MTYVILPKNKWDHKSELSDHPDAQRIGSWQTVLDVVQNLTGRAYVLAGQNVARKLHSGQRVYIQGDRSRVCSLLIQQIDS